MVLLWHHSEEPYPVPGGPSMVPCSAEGVVTGSNSRPGHGCRVLVSDHRLATDPPCVTPCRCSSRRREGGGASRELCCALGVVVNFLLVVCAKNPCFPERCYHDDVPISTACLEGGGGRGGGLAFPFLCFTFCFFTSL